MRIYSKLRWRINRTIFLKSIVLILLLSGFWGCNSKSSQTETIKLAHGLDTNHPVHKAMVFMAEKVHEKSDGKLRIDIYPSQQLGTERECVELLQIGSLGMTKVSGSVLESFLPAFKVLSLPYVFRDQAHRFNVLEGKIGKQLLLSGEPFLIRGLCYYDAGSRSFYTISKPVHTPDDLEGLKIRVMQSATAVTMVNTLGGAATPIAWGELYTALQQGVVDGAENNHPSFYYSKHYEVCKYYTIDEHTAVPDVLIISSKLWNNLSAKAKIWLQEAVDASAAYQKELWKEASHNALEAVKAAGVQVIYPDKRLFENKVQTLYESYKSEPEIYNLINQIKQMGKE